MGWAFTQTSAPLNVDYHQTTLGTKKGTADSFSVLGLFAFGDSSIATAAKNGGIKTVQHADYEYENILFLFQRATVVVYGD